MILSACFTDLNPWQDSNTVVDKTVVEGEAVILDVPPLDAHPQPDANSLEWYTKQGSNSVSQVLSDANHYITKEPKLQLVILATPFFYSDRLYEAKYLAHFLGSSSTSRRTRLQVTGMCVSRVPLYKIVFIPNGIFLDEIGLATITQGVINSPNKGRKQKIMIQILIILLWTGVNNNKSAAVLFTAK